MFVMFHVLTTSGHVPNAHFMFIMAVNIVNVIVILVAEAVTVSNWELFLLVFELWLVTDRQTPTHSRTHTHTHTHTQTLLGIVLTPKFNRCHVPVCVSIGSARRWAVTSNLVQLVVSNGCVFSIKGGDQSECQQQAWLDSRRGSFLQSCIAWSSCASLVSCCWNAI